MSEPREHFSEHGIGAPPWMSVRTAARQLETSEATIRRWLKVGILESVRFGATIRIRSESVYQRKQTREVAA